MSFWNPSSMYVENASPWFYTTPYQLPWCVDTPRQPPWCQDTSHQLPLDLSKKTGARPDSSMFYQGSDSTVASQGHHLANCFLSYARNDPLSSPYGPRSAYESNFGSGSPDLSLNSSCLGGYPLTPPVSSDDGGSTFSSPVSSDDGGSTFSSPISSCVGGSTFSSPVSSCVRGSTFSSPVSSCSSGSPAFSSHSACYGGSLAPVVQVRHGDSMVSCSSPGSHLQMELDGVVDDVLADINNEISPWTSANIPSKQCISPDSPYLYVTATNGATIPEKRQRSRKKEVKKYECPLCGDHLSTRSTLRVHIRRHTGQKPYMCSFCNKRFTQRSALHGHIRTHTNERPYACTACPKTFSDYSTFTKHYRIHTGERPYKCKICGNGFAQSGNLKRHLATHS